MLIADGFVFVWFGGVLLVGFIGFFIVLLVALGGLVRALFSPLLYGTRRALRGTKADSTPTARICGQSLCGHHNPGRARYCARCGRPLEGRPG